MTAVENHLGSDEYRVLQVSFECVHHYLPLPRGFSTVVKWCTCIIMKFQNHNHNERTVKLNPASDVLKIMRKNINIILLQIHHLLTAVENGNFCWHQKLTRNVVHIRK